jgi:hypothetical protein
MHSPEDTIRQEEMQYARDFAKALAPLYVRALLSLGVSPSDKVKLTKQALDFASNCPRKILSAGLEAQFQVIRGGSEPLEVKSYAEAARRQTLISSVIKDTGVEGEIAVYAVNQYMLAGKDPTALEHVLNILRQID